MRYSVVLLEFSSKPILKSTSDPYIQKLVDPIVEAIISAVSIWIEFHICDELQGFNPKKFRVVLTLK